MAAMILKATVVLALFLVASTDARAIAEAPQSWQQAETTAWAPMSTSQSLSLQNCQDVCAHTAIECIAVDCFVAKGDTEEELTRECLKECLQSHSGCRDHCAKQEEAAASPATPDCPPDSPPDDSPRRNN